MIICYSSQAKLTLPSTPLRGHLGTLRTPGGPSLQCLCQPSFNNNENTFNLSLQLCVEYHILTRLRKAFQNRGRWWHQLSSICPSVPTPPLLHPALCWGVVCIDPNCLGDGLHGPQQQALWFSGFLSSLASRRHWQEMGRWVENGQGIPSPSTPLSVGPPGLAGPLY